MSEINLKEKTFVDPLAVKEAKTDAMTEANSQAKDKPKSAETTSTDLAEAKTKIEEAKLNAKSALPDPPSEKKSVTKTHSRETVIEFKNVSKIYAGKVGAVDDVSFKVAPGEFISLVGPSGAGKSTLIKLLTCEEPPTKGQVLVAGRDISKLQPRELPYYRRKVGIIFQDFKLLPKKTVYENVAFALEVADVSSKEIAERVPKIIEIVGLTSRSKAFSEELSGGEKQRVSIARALVHKPKLLIADEPTGNLDPVATWEIIELLFKINSQGTIVLLATHDKEVVDALERRVITMRVGKIVSDQEKGKYIL